MFKGFVLWLAKFSLIHAKISKVFNFIEFDRVDTVEDKTKRRKIVYISDFEIDRFLIRLINFTTS